MSADMTLVRNAWAIIPAGGTGQRFSGTENKLLVHLLGKPVLYWTVNAFLNTPAIEGVILAVHPSAQSHYQAALEPLAQTQAKPLLWVHGGATRRDSVYQGLLTAKQQNPTALACIHDAARPLITPNDIAAALTPLQPSNQKSPAGTVLGQPITDTVKRVTANTSHIAHTEDRTTLWRAQTPQSFPLEIILQAHQAVLPEAIITDDAQLVELAQLGTIEMIASHSENLKITTPADVALAEDILRRRRLSQMQQ